MVVGYARRRSLPCRWEVPPERALLVQIDSCVREDLGQAPGRLNPPPIRGEKIARRGEQGGGKGTSFDPGSGLASKDHRSLSLAYLFYLASNNSSAESRANGTRRAPATLVDE